MNRQLLILIVGLTMIVSSCSDIEVFEKDSKQMLQNGCESITRSSNDTILCFESQEAFDIAVEKIASYNLEEDKFAYVHAISPMFVSIQDIYNDAMDDMAEMEDISVEEYDSFQSKYHSLYFPRYLEDAGYYIPMVNLDAAYLVNKNCEVCVAGEIVNLRDINNYETLVELGRAYYTIESMMPAVEITDIVFKEKMDPVGPEYDSGWTSYKFTKDNGNVHSRKAKLKARRKFIPDENYKNIKQFAAISLIHLEFCYRKGSPLGWANYKSSSDIVFRFNVPSNGWSINSIDDTHGMSSHDYEFMYPILYTTDKKYMYYVFEEAQCMATVNFADSNTPLTYNWTMPCLRDKDAYTAFPGKIISPHYGYYF